MLGAEARTAAFNFKPFYYTATFRFWTFFAFAAVNAMEVLEIALAAEGVAII